MATATAKKPRSHEATKPRRPELPTPPARAPVRPAIEDYGADEVLTDLLGFDLGRLRLLARREQLHRGGDQRVGQTIRDLLRRLLLDLGNRLDVRPLSAPEPAALALPADAGGISPVHADRSRVHDFENRRRREQVERATARGETTAQRNGDALTAEEMTRATAARGASEKFDNERRAQQTQREIDRRL